MPGLTTSYSSRPNPLVEVTGFLFPGLEQAYALERHGERGSGILARVQSVWERRPVDNDMMI